MNVENQILQILRNNPNIGRSQIASMLISAPSEASLKRIIAEQVRLGNIIVQGKGPATKYSLSPLAYILTPIDIETYFLSEIDQRQIQNSFNYELISNILPDVKLYTEEELKILDETQAAYRARVGELSETEYNKELERLGIDLSWKSSQIEGNTYTLLETERLLKQSQEAEGKTKEEALMLLNHKYAWELILQNPDYCSELNTHRIEDIHACLVKDLGVDCYIRRHRVGITGTNYVPPDNEWQIRDAMEACCKLINRKENIFEKALLAIVLLSYIQPFADGNKRTARMVGNAILIAAGYCPMSFRTVDSKKYKEAMLIFYEQNNISAFKQVFIDQYQFAVKTYF